MFGPGHPVCVVAEIANAHEGQFEKAQALCEAAVEHGADALKIQFIRADGLVVAGHPRHAHFQKLEFTTRQWTALFAIATRGTLPVLADVFDVESVGTLVRLGVAGFKIHASDTCNEPLICRVAQTRLPVLVSVGGALEAEIHQTLQLLQEWGPCPVVLLHGYQAYPTDPGDLHLRRIATLRERFQVPVGIQDHLDGQSPLAQLAPLMAVGQGVVMVEKHLTLNRSAQGIDYYSALEPEEFRLMVKRIRDAELLCGRAEMSLSDAERQYRKQVRKVVVTTRNCEAGEVLTHSLVTGKRADSGLSLDLLPRALGHRLRRAVATDTPVCPENIEWHAVVMIAVRMHSTRLPGKALLPLGGQPGIELLIERAKRATLPKRVVLCTSIHPNDQVLQPIAERHGIGFFAGSEDDVMDRFLKAGDREQADYVIRVTGDDPLVDPEYLDRLLLHHITEGADYSCMPGLPKGVECEVISMAALRKAFALAEDSSWSEYMTWYLKVPEVFTIRELPIEEAVRRPQYRLTLDYAEDLDVLRAVVGGIARPAVDLTVRDIVAWLDAHPDVARRNASVPSKALPKALNVKLKREPVSVG
jgi:N,N'-diacetyllegionaminate synthase